MKEKNLFNYELNKTKNIFLKTNFNINQETIELK